MQAIYMYVCIHTYIYVFKKTCIIASLLGTLCFIFSRNNSIIPQLLLISACIDLSELKCVDRISVLVMIAKAYVTLKGLFK